MLKMIMPMVCCLLLLDSPAWADSITVSGMFADQPVIYQGQQGGHLGPFFSPGMILQVEPGYRYLLVAGSGWTLIGINTDWVTRAVNFTAEFFDNGGFLITPPSNELGMLPRFGVTQQDFTLLYRDATRFEFGFRGYKIAEGFYQVPEPATWLLLGLGLILAMRLRLR